MIKNDTTVLPVYLKTANPNNGILNMFDLLRTHSLAQPDGLVLQLDLNWGFSVFRAVKQDLAFV
jgi:hypothetical protein